ncbi:MAG: hypothetical protein JJ868_20070 [Shimia sp.]|uniref:hypothetical protein n=1 Tax=Shimia sp. TaxID=1954381 RepID=UPI001B0F3D6B|nr:hypothetical protein [Shimia sp.]MBO6899655.1 hypothetical protein [Shimia sp.]
MQEENLAASVEYSFGAVSSDAVAAIIEAPEYKHPALALPIEVQKRLYVAPQYTGEQKALLDERWLNVQLGL